MSVVESAAPARPVKERELVVALTGASKRYGPIQALEDVDLELRAGEVHCLAGENGAGKSTLIKVLTGAVQRDSGTYEIERARRRQPDARSQARDAGVGVVYQELSLLPDLSVGENLLMGRLPARRGITRPGELRRQRARCSSASGSSGSTRARRSRRRRSPRASSSRSPRCSARSPRVIIFDEPTTALSESETKALLAHIHQLRDEGHAIMYVSHHLEEMFEIGDRVTVLRDGKLAVTEPMSDFDHDSLIASMVGRKIEMLYPARRARDRRAAAHARRAPPAGVDDADRPRRPLRRDPRHRRPARLGPHASCCARSSAPTPSTAATSRSTASASRPAARGAPCAPASGC